jgi:hypothetical protein
MGEDLQRDQEGDNQMSLNPTIALGHIIDEYREHRRPGFPMSAHYQSLYATAARSAVRTAIDTVVAQACGLTLDQYAHILSTFGHSSYKDAPRQCLAAFDELQSLGLEAFTKKHDPYWDIPLNENFPQPVIDLPIPEFAPDAAPAKSHKELFDFQTTPAPAGNGVVFAEQPAVEPKRTLKNS